MSSLCPGHLAAMHGLEAEQRGRALRGILLVDSEALPPLTVLGDGHWALWISAGAFGCK